MVKQRVNKNVLILNRGPEGIQTLPLIQKTDSDNLKLSKILRLRHYNF